MDLLYGEMAGWWSALFWVFSFCEANSGQWIKPKEMFQTAIRSSNIQDKLKQQQAVSNRCNTADVSFLNLKLNLSIKFKILEY